MTEGNQNGTKKNLKTLESLEKLFWGPKNDQIGFKMMIQMAHCVGYVHKLYEC